jgi:hypothetical protein
MEVHHHVHPAESGTHTASNGSGSSRKKWTHYIWEFIMLFLAVFCGFLAENFREHQVEHRREKSYIKSLVKTLNSISSHLGILPMSEKDISIIMTRLFFF